MFIDVAQLKVHIKEHAVYTNIKLIKYTMKCTLTLTNKHIKDVNNLEIKTNSLIKDRNF